MNQDRSRSLRRMVLVLSSVSAALTLTVAVLITELQDRLASADLTAPRQLSQDEIDQLIRDTTGIYDTHPDPDVGRTLLPGLVDRGYLQTSVTTNELGWREREVDVPRPAGRIRVLLLGDSYIFGAGVEAEQRLGVSLESQLRQRSSGLDVEVLHLGVLSWNIVAECAYLRRNLEEIAPHAVIHVIVENDLDDCATARGFGELATYTAQHRDRANSLIRASHPATIGQKSRAPLLCGLDGESRERFARAASELERLANALASVGCRYLLVCNVPRHSQELQRLLTAGLEPSQVCYVPKSLLNEDQYQISQFNPHWSPLGHDRIATALYGLIVERELLPIPLGEWSEATALAATFVTPLIRNPENRARQLIQARGIGTSIAFGQDATGLTQIYGGLNQGGVLAPYASVVLRRAAASRLRIQGRRLDRVGLAGEVAVVIDGREVGSIGLAPPGEFDAEFPLPESTNPLVNVRLVAEDYVFSRRNHRDCEALQLSRIEVE